VLRRIALQPVARVVRPQLAEDADGDADSAGVHITSRAKLSKRPKDLYEL
jgi:hypothetical protein